MTEKAKKPPKLSEQLSPEEDIARILARIEREPIPQRLFELALKLQKALNDKRRSDG